MGKLIIFIVLTYVVRFLRLLLKRVCAEIKLNNISLRKKATIFEPNESNIFMDDYIICLNMNYLSTIFKATAQKGLRKNELE